MSIVFDRTGSAGRRQRRTGDRIRLTENQVHEHRRKSTSEIRSRRKPDVGRRERIGIGWCRVKDEIRDGTQAETPLKKLSREILRERVGKLEPRKSGIFKGLV